MNQAVQIFTALPDGAMVAFDDKKGISHFRTIEGAIWKGGAALRSLKDAAAQSAVTRAAAGRYKSASEIIGDTYGVVNRAFTKAYGNPYNNALSMAAFITAVEQFQPKPGKILTKKQVVVAELVKELRTINALSQEVKAQVILTVVEEAQDVK